MLRAHALSDLFTENTSTPITNIFLATTSGHLVGLSSSSSQTSSNQSQAPISSTPPSITPLARSSTRESAQPSTRQQATPQDLSHKSSLSATTTRKLAVLSGLTWRFYNPSYTSPSSPTSTQASFNSSSHGLNGFDPARPGLTAGPSAGISGAGGRILSNDDLAEQAAKTVRVRPLPVLGQTAGSSDDGPGGMVVKGESRVIALGYVGQGLVLGVVGEGVNVVVNARNGRSRGLGIGENGSDEGDSDSEEEDDIDGREDQLQEAERELGRILSVKAEALAEFLRGELGGFRMPREEVL